MYPPRTAREGLLWYLEKYLGTWYSWGGDDPAGFDCSGLIVEGLKAFGVLPRKGDWTANTLMDGVGLVPANFEDTLHGDLIFWLDDTLGATHVEALWWIKRFSIGAAGGTRNTLTKEDAMRDNAFVRIRPWASRGGPVAFRHVPFS